MNRLRELTSSKLEKALEIKRQIERLEVNLDALITSTMPGPLASMHRTRRRMSAAARKRISDAAKARWARFRAGKGK